MDTSEPQSSKQLKEHLQHHQEPFSLQSYLAERSYMFENFNFGSSNINSAKNLKWSIKYDIHKIRKRLLHATGMLRSLLYKFIPTDDNHEFSNWDEEHISDLYYVHELTAVSQTTQQTNLAVSGHFTNNDVQDKVLPANMMFQTFTLPKLRRSEVDAGTKPFWISSKDSRGLEWKEPLPSAVCHLKSPEGEVALPVPTLSQKLVRDYVRKLLANSNILKFRRARKDKLEDMVETASLCQRNRSSLPKRKQRWFDYVEKDRVFHEHGGKSVSNKAVSESEDFQSMIHEHFSFLEKQYIEVKKMKHLLYAESCVISEEWKSFQIVNWEIYMEIGDSITDDIVREIIDLF
ncbi:uncharacterized protein LOC109799787 [Cajanus cajan]|uniref:DUF4378 domain-containing protein n=1 Tax=Cajanus cajan TaxID=3821 RepID=A0A151TK12_CAJCA|nr:uncharacterized protein LOC109799787 [Cajanus cajan]KYP67393.1 hypothetical protein KK1_013721 [Cajanus cajan]